MAEIGVLVDDLQVLGSIEVELLQECSFGLLFLQDELFVVRELDFE